MKRTSFPIILACVIIGSGICYAGTTGKIVGRITDQETGEPLIGCNVVIVGTSQGAASDQNGNFVILNVPPGYYDVRAMMIGYTPMTIQGVDVAVDLTSRAEFALQVEVLGGEEVNVVAQRATVRLDQTSMAAVMDAAEIENLPANEVTELIEMQAGVVKDADGGLHVRGGRSGEVSFWVDGIQTTDVYDGSMGLEVENSAIQELQVISGTFNAEYGNAMSAVVNIVTKDGGDKLAGGIDIYGGGYHTYDDQLYTIASTFEEWAGYEDVNGNGKWDRGEWWNDLNGNLTWDPGENFADDDGDGVWDPGEPLNSDVGLDGQAGDPMDNGSQVRSRYSDNDGIRNEASVGEGDGIMQWGEHRFTLDKGGYVDKLNTLLHPLQLKNIQAHLGGPAPILGDLITFYSTFRYFSTQNWYYGKRLFEPTGFFGDEKIVPLAPYAKLSGQLKATFQPSAITKLSYSLFYDEKQYRSYDENFKYNPDGLRTKFEEDISHIISWTQTLSPRTFFEAKVIDFSSSFWEYYTKDADDIPFEEHQSFIYPVSSDTLTIRTREGEYILPRYLVFDSLWVATESGDSAWQYQYVDVADREGYVDPLIMEEIPGWSFFPGGTQGERWERNTSYRVLKFDLSSQVNLHNQLKVGLEFKQYDLWADGKSVGYQTLGDWGITTQGDTIGFNPLAGARTPGYTPTILPTYSTSHSYFRNKPYQISGYIQDKLELDDLIINLGVRYDYFNPKGVVPRESRFPSNRKYYLASTALDTVVFWQFEYPDLHSGVTLMDSLTAEGAVKAENLMGEGITDELAWQDLRDKYRWEYGYKDAPVSFQFSPRLGLSYPITDKGAIHVSYGHFFQVPKFEFLYHNPEFEIDVSNTDFERIIGNAALKPERTVMYEVGVKQEVASLTSFDFTLFYRDTRDWVGMSAPIDLYPVGNYYKYENRDYANTRGFTASLNRAYSQGLGFSLYYSWMVAEGTYSDSKDAYFEMRDNEAPRISLVPLNWDQTHTLNASLTVGGNRWIAALIGEFWSGRPYTPEFKVGAIAGAAAFSGYSENSDRLPSYFNVDLRTSYRVYLFGLGATLYINVFNLFDIRNEIDIWKDTGRASYTLTARDVPEVSVDRIGTLHEHLHKPDWYSEPRKINVGLSLNF